MKTVEELYAEAQATITKLTADASEARATITKLNADAEAGAALLTESQAKVTELTKNNEALTLAHSEIKAQRDELAGKVTAFTTQTTSLTAQVEALTKENGEHKAAVLNATAKIGKLEAEARTAEERAAEYYGAGGKPAAVTAKGQSDDELVARFKAITDPAAQTNFWRSLSAAQQQKLQSLLSSNK